MGIALAGKVARQNGIARHEGLPDFLLDPPKLTELPVPATFQDGHHAHFDKAVALSVCICHVAVGDGLAEGAFAARKIPLGHPHTGHRRSAPRATVSRIKSDDGHVIPSYWFRLH
jgi:hypothetical protein